MSFYIEKLNFKTKNKECFQVNTNLLNSSIETFIPPLAANVKLSTCR